MPPRLALLTSALAATAAVASAADPCTGLDYAEARFPAAYAPRAVVLGDLDGDGDADVAVANSQGPLPVNETNHVSILDNRGDAGLSAPRSYPAGTNPQDLACGDLDGDGDLDLVVTDRGYYDYGLQAWKAFGVTLLFNDGSGGFDTSTFHAFPAGHEEPWAVALGDLDGDGDLDLAATIVSAGYGKSELAVRLNDGAGHLAPPSFAAVGLAPRDLALGDLDGDGHLDAVTVNHQSNTASILYGDGAGAFAGPGTTLYVPTYPERVALGDLDGDGDLDLAVTEKYGVKTVRNLGGGSYALIGLLGAGLRPTALALADLDGDGDLDLAASDLLGDGVGLYLNDGSGLLSGPTTMPLSDAPNSMAAADLDADGDADVVVACLSSADAAVLANACATPVLVADTGAVSLSAGGAQTLSIAAGAEHAGQSYWVAGSVTGSVPGFDLGPVHVPLVIDPYFLVSLSSAGSGPLVGTVGVLDGAGAATAQIAIPPAYPPALAGLTLRHAAIVFVTHAELASAAVSLDLVP